MSVEEDLMKDIENQQNNSTVKVEITGITVDKKYLSKLHLKKWKEDSWSSIPFYRKHTVSSQEAIKLIELVNKYGK